MRRAIIGLFAIVFGFGVLVVLPKQAHAQFACDVCGLCQTSTAVPGNWASCAECMYDYTGNSPVVPVPQPLTQSDSANYPSLFNVAIKEKSYTALGCIESSPGKFSEFIIRLMANLITGIGILGIVYGGLKVMMARGDKSAVQEGKTYVVAAIAAIVIVNFAALIVKFAGENILQLPFFK